MSTLSTLLLPPAVFLGLGVTLWTYKCLMMILFQNKIIYLPNIPPFSRSEKVEDYERVCWPVVWKGDQLVTDDGVRVSVLVGNLEDKDKDKEKMGEEGQGGHLVVLYFQGNASSLPPRLPFLSDVLKLAHAGGSRTRISIVAVSYRGYWTSSGRASQQGIEKDADAALSWLLQKYSHLLPRLRILIWGQSIGAGVATGLTAAYLNTPFPGQGQEGQRRPPIDALILETPFTKVKDILLSLYPQKWLPYRYLDPFLRSHWDSMQAVQAIAEAKDTQQKPKILILEAGSDEVVPPGNAEELERRCRTLNLGVERKVISGALHSDVVANRDGRYEIARFLRERAYS